MTDLQQATYWLKTHYKFRHDGWTKRQCALMISHMRPGFLDFMMKVNKPGDFDIKDGFFHFGQIQTRKDLVKFWIRQLRQLKNSPQKTTKRN